MINKLLFENVRCFYGEHTSLLRPLTFLLGENSSGKTSFLALNRIAWDIAQGDLSDDIFNEDPFQLGAYDQIASHKGGRAGRSKTFTIGCEVSLSSKVKRPEIFSNEVIIKAKFTSQSGQPKLDQWIFNSGKFGLEMRFGDQNRVIEAKVSNQTSEYAIPEKAFLGRMFNPIRVLRELNFMIRDRARGIEKDIKPTEHQDGILTQDDLNYLESIYFSVMRSLGARPYAFAPIRTSPRRTYDRLKDVQEPGGDHIPMVLANMSTSNLKEWEGLREQLISFGEASGLFTDIEIKRKGKKESDPFQIDIKNFGQPFNLVDVGYGVSQVLPIVVDIFQKPQQTSFLLQQPEVHLHPRAQAELGTVLGTLAKTQSKRFIVETHSDFLIDRIRMDIRDKKTVEAKDVAILYFERSKSGVHVHHLEVDDQGNIVNPPPSYRQFFLQEERRFLLG